MEKEEIKKTVEDLYALRAGMSLLSKKMEKAKVAEKALKDLKESTNKTLNKTIEQIVEKEKEIAKNEETEKKNIEEKLRKREKEYKDICDMVEADKFCGVFFLIITLICTAVPLIIKLVKGSVSGWVLVPCIIVFIPSAFFVVCSLCSLPSDRRKIIDVSPERIPTIISFEKQMTKRINNKLKNEIEKLRHDRGCILKQFAQETEKQEKIMHPIMCECKIIFTELSDKFSYLLDPRDWENVDIIIYMLETGRSESIKEALNNADLKKYFEDLVKIVNSNAISLRNMLSDKFSSLHAAIDNCASLIQDGYERNSKLLGEIKSETEKHLIAAEINNATMESINVSCRDMAENIDRIRFYEDQRYLFNKY